MATRICLPSSSFSENDLKTIVYYDFTKTLEDLCGNTTTNNGNVTRDTTGALFNTNKQIVNDIYLTATKDFTFEFIFNIQNNNNYQSLLVCGAGNGGLQVLYNKDSQKMQIGRYGTGGLSLATNTTFNGWSEDTHLAVVKRNNEFKIYINGILQGTTTGTISTTYTVYISGYINKTYPINGKLKMFKITQKALNADEFER